MTDTGPPTNLGTITVVGQRRQPDGSFPRPAGGGTGGGSGSGSGVQQTEVSPEDPNPPSTGFDPCANPETALPWNADAAGAGSPGQFRIAAGQLGFADAPNGTPTLSNREFGRGLARGPNGAVVGNAVSWGPPIPPGGVGGMTVDFTGISYTDYIGDAHSHPNGNPLPSQSDWDGFMFNNNQARLAGRTGETFYMYVFAVNPDGITGTSYVYQDGPRAANSPDPPRPTTIGPEVNPNAQPC